MTAALFAVLALAHRRLLEHADMLGPGRDAHGVRLPQGEGIDRPARPRTARAAVTISHALGLPRDFDLDGSAETFAFVCGHDRSEEHTSELQSRFGISYAVFCLKKKTNM